MEVFKKLPVVGSVLSLLKWYDKQPLPEGRTYRTTRRGFYKFRDIVRTNKKGQVVNLARNTGTDNKNVAELQDSFRVNGVAISQQIPFIGINDQLYDGFSRCKALENLGYDGWIFNVIEPNDGFTWSDVWAEVGLGANNHLPCKKALVQDFTTGLSHYIEEQEETPTQGECVDWVNNIPHQFKQSEVGKIAEKALKNHRTYVSMESFTAAEVLANAKAQNTFTNRVSIIPLNISGKSSYFQRGIFNVLDQISNPKKDMNVVYAFTKDIPADEVAEVRKAAIDQEEKINAQFLDLFKKYEAHKKSGRPVEDFKVLDIRYWVGQVIGEESGFISRHHSKTP